MITHSHKTEITTSLTTLALEQPGFREKTAPETKGPYNRIDQDQDLRTLAMINSFQDFDV